jgi:hypothetical protein
MVGPWRHIFKENCGSCLRLAWSEALGWKAYAAEQLLEARVGAQGVKLWVGEYDWQERTGLHALLERSDSAIAIA